MFRKAADAGFVKSGLAQKGVKFIDATKENSEAISKAFNKSIPSWVQRIPQLKIAFEKKINLEKGIVEQGNNAMFLPKSNVIIIKKSSNINCAAFHEMGHAMNKNMGGLGKVLQKMRLPFAIASTLTLATALLKRKKVEGEKPKNAFDSVTTFIKNNCGKLAFLGFVPIVMEEGLASIKGAKLAKGILSADQLKTLNKLYGKAWLTYLSLAVGVGLSAFTVSKVRDLIAKPKEINAQTKL